MPYCYGVLRNIKAKKRRICFSCFNSGRDYNFTYSIKKYIFVTVVSEDKTLNLQDIRTDEIIPSLVREDVFSNVPKCMQGYVVTGKVVD